MWSVAEETAGAGEAETDNQSQRAGFYHDPLLWVGESPVDWSRPRPSGQMPEVNLGILADVVYEGRAGPIGVEVLREGLFWFDFADWPEAHQRH